MSVATKRERAPLPLSGNVRSHVSIRGDYSWPQMDSSSSIVVCQCAFSLVKTKMKPLSSGIRTAGVRVSRSDADVDLVPRDAHRS